MLRPQEKVNVVNVEDVLPYEVSSFDDLFEISGDDIFVTSGNAITYKVMPKNGPFRFNLSPKAPLALQFAFEKISFTSIQKTRMPLKPDDNSDLELWKYKQKQTAYHHYLILLTEVFNKAITFLFPDIEKKFETDYMKLDQEYRNLIDKIDNQTNSSEEIIKDQTDGKLLSDAYDRLRTAIVNFNDYIKAKFYIDRLKTNAVSLAKYIYEREQAGHPVLVIALQEADLKATTTIRNELEIDWINTGYSPQKIGGLFTLYNRKYYVEQNLGQESNQCYLMDLFKKKNPLPGEPEEMIYVNMYASSSEDDISDTVFDPVLTHLHSLRKNNIPICFIGTSHQTFPNQVGAGLVLTEDDLGYQKTSLILNYIPDHGMIFPEQTALGQWGNTLKPILVALPLTDEDQPLINIDKYNHNLIQPLNAALTILKAAISSSLQRAKFPMAIANSIELAIKERRIPKEQETPLINLMGAVTLLIRDNQPSKGFHLLNTVAIAGIENYLSKDRSHLSEVNKFFDGDRGINRANRYLEELRSNKSPFYKEIFLYALLASEDGKTLQKHIIVGEAFKSELSAHFQARLLKAAGGQGEGEKAVDYRLQLDEIINEISENINTDGKVPDEVKLKVSRFERSLGHADKLIDNIQNTLKELTSGRHAGLKDIQDLLADSKKALPNRWKKISDICRKRLSYFTSLTSHMKFFYPPRNPRMDLIYQVIPDLDQCRMFNPKMETLDELINAWQKLQAIAEFEKEIDRLEPYNSENPFAKLKIDNYSDEKIHAYKTLIDLIKHSWDSNITIRDILDPTKLQNIPVKKDGTREDVLRKNESLELYDEHGVLNKILNKRNPLSIYDALNSKRLGKSKDLPKSMQNLEAIRVSKLAFDPKTILNELGRNGVRARNLNIP